MFDGMQGLDIVRDSGVTRTRAGVYDWVITLRSQRGHSLKLEAHHDGYANQSYARLSLWSDNEGWNVLVSRRGDEIPQPAPLTPEFVSSVAADLEDLTLEGCTLLGLME